MRARGWAVLTCRCNLQHGNPAGAAGGRPMGGNETHAPALPPSYILHTQTIMVTTTAAAHLKMRRRRDDAVKVSTCFVSLDLQPREPRSLQRRRSKRHQKVQWLCACLLQRAATTLAYSGPSLTARDRQLSNFALTEFVILQLSIHLNAASL